MSTTRKIALMGYLIGALANCGSRKADGSVNASGLCYLYKAGTIQQEFGYSDSLCTVPISTTGGAISLDGAGKRTIYMKAPADVVVADSTGTQVDNIPAFNNHRAELVEVQNGLYTGSITDPGTGAVSQGLGGITSLQSILTSAALSFGPNFQYQLTGGTARNVQDWMKNVGVFAGDFGAKFDGQTDDTVAIQKAIDFVASLGGGKVLLPPGTGLIGTGGSGLTVSHSGTILQGAGSGVTTLKNASGTVSPLTFTGTDGIGIRGMSITTSSGTSTGTGIAISTATGVLLDDLNIQKHNVCVSLSSVSRATVSGSCYFFANQAVAGARAIKATATSTWTILGGSYGGGDYDIELFSGGGSFAAVGAAFIGANFGVRFDTTVTGNGFTFLGGTTAGVPFSFGLTTFPLGFYQRGNFLGDGTSHSGAIGSTLTPSLVAGHEITLAATSGGAGTQTVNAPTVLPNTTDRDRTWIFKFVNGSGGAVTWSLNAVYKVTAAIPTTDAHTIVVEFLWDVATSKFREMSRADIAT